MILRAQARLAIATPAAKDGGRMKCVHGVSIRSAKTDVHAARCKRSGGFKRDRELDAKGARHRAPVGSALLEVLEVDYSDDPERSKHRVVKATASLQVANP